MEESYVLNTTEENSTAYFDPFCDSFPLGPLVWAVLSVPCACVGVPASAWLLWVLIQRQREGLTNDTYIVNLTVMDLVFNIFKLPDVFNFLFWRSYKVLDVSVLIGVLSLCGRPQLMCLMSVDCYMAVVHPIFYKNIHHQRYRVVACLLVYVVTVASLCGHMFVRHKAIFIAVDTVRILSVSVIVLCNFITLWVLRKPDPFGRRSVHPQKQKVLQVVTNTFIMTVISYLPLILVVGFSSLLGLSEMEHVCSVYVPSLVATTFGSAVMPVISLANLGKIKGLQKMAKP